MTTTATLDHHAAAGHAAVPLTARLSAPFIAVGHFLVRLAEASPRMRALEHLGTVTDAELSARGLTRDGEIRRILGVAAAV